MSVPDAGAAVGLGVRVPWSAWTDEREMVLGVPPGWDSVALRMADAPALSREAMARALAEPIGASPLASVARGKHSASIAIDDRTRPLKTAVILRAVVDELTRAGISNEHITVIVASGAHRPASDHDFAAKIGRELLAQVRAVAHDPERNLVETGATLGGVPVRVNRDFAAAELRIGIGSVIPHPFAGFSGGGKIVLPGLADLDVLARTHKFALMGFRGGGPLEGNRFRSEMETAVRQIGLDWTVNVAVNSQREAAGVFAGDMVEAHRAAAGAAAAIGLTPAPDRLLDAIVLNAFPKDGELLQVEAALVPLRNGMMSWLTPTAPVVLSAACPQGLGYHGLFGPGGRLFRTPSRRSFLNDHPLIIFSPDSEKEDVAKLFWEGYPLCRTWEAVLSTLTSPLNERGTIGIVPCAPLQVAADTSVARP